MFTNLKRCFVVAGAVASYGLPACAAPAAAPPAPVWVAPLLTGVVGVATAYIAIWFDRRKTSNQELIKKRIAIYDEVAPKLNELYCFLMARGMFRTLTPPEMVAHKRALDHAFYVYGPLFSEETFDRFQVFIHTCFETFTGVGHDAKLRANLASLRHEIGPGWQAAWDTHFVGQERAASQADVARSYQQLMDELASQIGARRRRRWFPKRAAPEA